MKQYYCSFYQFTRIEEREFLDTARLDEWFDHTGISKMPRVPKSLHKFCTIA
jgi:hypothetical protein